MNIKSLIIIFISLLLIGCSRQVSNESTYTGTIEAEDISLNTEITGKLINIYIKDGQKVEKGTKIAELDTTDLKIKLKKLKLALLGAETKLDEILEGSRGEDIKNARANMKNIEMQLEGARKNYEYRLQNYNNIVELFSNSAVSKQQIEDAKALVQVEETKVKSLEKQLEASKSRLDLLLSGATKQKIKLAEAEVDMAKVEIELLENQISKGNIIAPINGTIESIYYDIGEFVPLGGNIGKIIDLENLWVKIYVPEKELHKVSINQVVNLSPNFSDGEIISGKVIYISPEAEFTPQNVESKENKEEMVFEVKIKLLDTNSSLKPGMLIDINLRGDL